MSMKNISRLTLGFSRLYFRKNDYSMFLPYLTQVYDIIPSTNEGKRPNYYTSTIFAPYKLGLKHYIDSCTQRYIGSLAAKLSTNKITNVGNWPETKESNEPGLPEPPVNYSFVLIFLSFLAGYECRRIIYQ